MRRSRVILLVHPDDGIRVTYQVVLRREGYVVLEATNTSEALEQIKESVPDLLITQTLLPRLDGVKLIRLIRSDQGDQPLRILALGAESAKRDATAAGADDFQETPVAPEQLVRAVTSLIGRA